MLAIPVSLFMLSYLLVGYIVVWSGLIGKIVLWVSCITLEKRYGIVAVKGIRMKTETYGGPSAYVYRVPPGMVLCNFQYERWNGEVVTFYSKEPTERFVSRFNEAQLMKLCPMLLERQDFRERGVWDVNSFLLRLGIVMVIGAVIGIFVSQAMFLYKHAVVW